MASLVLAACRSLTKPTGIVPAAFLLLGAPLAAQRIITTAAGAGPLRFGEGVPAITASIGRPDNLAADASGNVYIADSFSQAVRKIDRKGIITTVAGSGLASSRAVRGDGGPAVKALLLRPTGVAVDSAGSLFIADGDDNTVRKVTPDGIISTVAGNGRRGFSGESGPALTVSLNFPTALAVDSRGNLYIADSSNQRIRKVNPQGMLTSFAGGGDFSTRVSEGISATSLYMSPRALAVDRADNVYACCSTINVVRISPAGTVTRLYGGGTSEAEGVPSASAPMGATSALAVDAAGNIFFAVAPKVRMISTSDAVSTVAGTSERGFSGDGGPAAAARLDTPRALAIDAAGTLYVGDESGGRIRAIFAAPPPSFTPSPRQLLFTGSSLGPLAPPQKIDLPPARSELAFSVAITTPGQPCWLRVTPASGVMPATLQVEADPAGLEPGQYQASIDIFAPGASPNRQTIEVSLSVDLQQPDLTPSYAGGIITTWAGGGTSEDDGIQALDATFSPEAVAIDAADNLYVINNWLIRKITPDGMVATVAGSRYGNFPGDGGPATEARLNPKAITLDGAGNLYIADTSRIRKVSPDGIISTIAGTGQSDFSGDGGPATEASFSTPSAMVVDPRGNLYFGDSFSGRIRRIDTDGIITTVAGSGGTGPSIGNGGPATEALIRFVYGLAFDPEGNLHILDGDSVRKILPSGIIVPVAGSGGGMLSEEGLQATRTSLIFPRSIAFNPAGDLYISNAAYVMKVSAATGLVSWVAGRAESGFFGDGGPARFARLGGLTWLALDSAGNLYLSDAANGRIRRVAADGPATR